jgi:mRNA interferase YafQ
MLKLIFERRFKKDVEKAQRRNKEMTKLKEIIRLLSTIETLPAKHNNHKLKGDYTNHWECHIEPDWLLIYKKTTTELILVRTGTHADLF